MRDGWQEVTLGEVVRVNPETARFDPNHLIQYIDLASVSWIEGIDANKVTTYSFGDAPGRARRLIDKDDVLVATVRPYLRGIARVPAHLAGEVASTGFAVLRAIPRSILPGFVWLVVTTGQFTSGMMDRATGSNYPAVRPQDVAQFPICLPPLEEQHRIVDLLEAVDNAIDAAHQMTITTKETRSALLSDLLAPERASEEGWQEVTLGEVVRVNPETARFDPNHLIQYIDLASVSWIEGIDANKVTTYSFGDAPGRARRLIDKDDVLVATVRPYLRGIARVPAHLAGEVASTGFAVLRAIPRSILPGFVWLVVTTGQFTSGMMDRATGSNYPAVRPQDVAQFPICLPPLEEQHRIVDLLEAVDSHAETAQSYESSLRKVRSALLHDLLSGDHEIPDSYDQVLEVRAS